MLISLATPTCTFVLYKETTYNIISYVYYMWLGPFMSDVYVDLMNVQ